MVRAYSRPRIDLHYNIAEITDKIKEPKLFNIVTKCMIHGPCKGYDESNVCCQGKSGAGGKCGKEFPKTCTDDLVFDNNGYPMYQRSFGSKGHSFVKRIDRNDVTIDN